MTDRFAQSRREILSLLGTAGTAGAVGVGTVSAACSGDLRSFPCGETMSSCVDGDDPTERFSCGPACDAMRYYEPVSFDGTKGCTVTVTASSDGGDVGIQLLDPSGTAIESTDTTDGSDARIRATLDTTGTYEVKVYPAGDSWVPIGYTLSIDCGCDGNTPPNAEFTIDPRDPAPDEIVTFDAGDSGDPDGSIVSYEWDFDGDGSFQYDGTPLRVKFTEGETTVTLRVTDDDGATDTASKHVVIESGGTAALTVDDATTTAGGTATFDVELENTGDATIGDDESPIVNVSWQGESGPGYPDGWSVVDWSTSHGGFDYYTWSGFSLAPGETATASITVETANDASGEYGFDWELATVSKPDSPIATDTATVTITDGVQLSEVHPVQVTADSRITGDPSYDFPTYPPLIPERKTGLLFDVDGSTIDELPDGETVTVTASVDGETRDAVEYTKDDLETIDFRDHVTRYAFFRGGRLPPMVDLPEDASSLRLELSTNSDGGSGAASTKTITEGSGFTVSDPGELKVGVVELEPPGSGSYGSVSDFDGAVDEIERHLRRKFPTRPGSITVKSVPDPVEGILPGSLPEYLNAVYVNRVVTAIDQANAHDAVEKAFPDFDFDAALVVVADDYFDSLGYERDLAGTEIGLPVGNDEAQPQFAATATESGCPTTALHELGHHFLPWGFYPDVAAQRREGGKIDEDHARTRDHNVTGDVADPPFEPGDDEPGVVTTYFDLVDDGDPPKDVPEADALMSYADDHRTPDTLMYEKLTEGFEPRPPTKSLGGTVNTVMSVIGVVVDGSLEVLYDSAHRGAPSPTTTDGNLTVSVEAEDGSEIERRQVPGGLQFHPAGTGVTSPSEFELENVYRTTVPAPEEASTLKMEHESGASTEISVPDVDLGPVERADTDDDGDIDTGELQTAVREWTSGEYSTRDLQRIIQAWVRSG